MTGCPGVPPPSGVTFTDTHCHLADPTLGDPRPVLNRAAAAGVRRVVVVGSDPASNRVVLALARHEVGVLPALGFHPERLDLDDAALEEVEGQVRAHRSELAALGEIGLPWYGLAGRPDRAGLAARARERLRRLLGLARREGLPISLHAPHGTAEEALALLETCGVGPAVFHWHKAAWPVTRAVVAAGHLLGVTPQVVYRERDRELVRAVGLAPLVLESDAPWPVGGPFADGPGEPALIPAAAGAIAGILGCPLEEVAAVLEENVRRWLRPSCRGPVPGGRGE